MDTDTLAVWCQSLAKAYSIGVRLYRGEEPLTYCSVYPLHPDPAGPYLPRILGCGAEVGIITTPAYQFYGFLTPEPGLRVIFGPTRALRGDGRELDGLMALLAVPPEEWTGYAQALRSAPVISAHRLCAQYVSQNIFTAIRAERMAEELGYTRAYLCTRFKQETGISLTRYVQREKVAEARRLLRFTDQSLGEIAALLGFSSQSHFQTVFKQVTGDTPMAYRRSSQVLFPN